MFKDLKNLSSRLNEAFSSVLLPFVIDVMFFYSTHLIDIAIVQSYYTRFALVISLCVNCLTFFFAADACQKASAIRNLNFVSFRQKKHSWKKERHNAIILAFVHNYPIALTGGGILTINFPFIFSVKLCTPITEFHNGRFNYFVYND